MRSSHFHCVLPKVRINGVHIQSNDLELVKTSKWKAHFPFGNSVWEFWGVFHLQKFRNISIANFRLGKARSICHKFHSREPREVWPLKRLKDRESYEIGDKSNKDEKSVNETQISIGKFPPGKRDYLFRSSVYFGKFSVERTKKSCLFTSQPEFPEFLVDGKRPWSTFQEIPFSRENFRSGRQNCSFHLQSIRNFRILWVNGKIKAGFSFFGKVSLLISGNGLI